MWPEDKWGTGWPYPMTRPYGGGFHGMGPSMMMHGLYAKAPGRLPDLTTEQAEKIEKLQNDMLERNLGIMRQTWEARTRLDNLYSAERRDWDAIRAVSRNLSDLQRQQTDSAIEFQQKIDGLLTDAQRRQIAYARGNCSRQ